MKDGASDLDILNESQIQLLESALREVGEFGEVRLIVNKGRLRFVVTQRSHDALEWERKNKRGTKPLRERPSDGGSQAAQAGAAASRA